MAQKCEGCHMNLRRRRPCRPTLSRSAALFPVAFSRPKRKMRAGIALRKSTPPKSFPAPGKIIMADSTPCPDLRELQRLSANALSPDDVARLARHLAICPRCAETVEQLKETDTLAEQIRARSQVNGSPALEPRLDRATDTPVEGTPTVSLNDA